MPDNAREMLEREFARLDIRKTSYIRRVAAYCRVSTNQEYQKDSFGIQLDYYKRLLKTNPRLELVEIYSDLDASGLSIKRRDGFRRMMGDCLDGKVDIILTKSVSRFARNLADCVTSVRLLRDRGVAVLFEKEGLSSMDSHCELMLSLFAAMAQEEVNNLSQNIRWSFEQRNAMGDPARAARYGYRKSVDEKSRLVWRVFEPEAERVRLAFELASKGKRNCEIITRLNDIESRDGTLVRWTHTRLIDMLKSEVYMGDILTNQYYVPDFLDKKCVKNNGQRHQYYIEDHHQPLIDRRTYELVHEIRRLRKKKHGR